MMKTNFENEKYFMVTEDNRLIYRECPEDIEDTTDRFLCHTIIEPCVSSYYIDNYVPTFKDIKKYGWKMGLKTFIKVFQLNDRIENINEYREYVVDIPEKYDLETAMQFYFFVGDKILKKEAI